jgi:lysyl-tRNA synthetase, class II
MPSARSAWTRRLAALATALAGVVTLASSLSPNAPGRSRLLARLDPDAAQTAAHAVGVAGGLATLALALGVLQGRRRAGRAAMVVLGVLAIVHLVKGLDYEEALLGLAVAFGLERLLRARADRPAASLTGLLVVLVALGAAYGVALTRLFLATDSPRVGHDVVRAAETVAGAVAPTGVERFLLALAAGALAALARALLAPVRASAGHDATEHHRVAALVAAHGEDSIAPFALRADKSFHFAAGGALAYRVLGGTAVVAGDPIGPPGSANAVMASFMERARDRGWDVVLIGAGADRAAGYAALGLRTLQVGLEAIVDPSEFDLGTPAAKSVRKAVARVRRHGWTTEIRTGAQLDPATTAEIAAVEAAWRNRQRRLYGFAWAHDRLWGAPEDASDVYAIARNPSGEARAFQRYVRYRRGLSLDAMRRLDDEPNGISDSLVAAVLEHARRLGDTEVSLNFSSFAHLLGAATPSRRRHRLACWALRRLRGPFQLERLMRFAQKFGPEWRPRYLVYTARTRLPVAAVRVLQAEAYIRARPPRRARGAWAPARIPLPGDVAVASPR